MGARLTEVLETIAVRTEVRVAIITGAGEHAFSVGSDLRQRKNMTKEQWLRQRQDFDRTLYTLRQLRKPIFAAVNRVAYGGGAPAGGRPPPARSTRCGSFASRSSPPSTALPTAGAPRSRRAPIPSSPPSSPRSGSPSR